MSIFAGLNKSKINRAEQILAQEAHETRLVLQEAMQKLLVRHAQVEAGDGDLASFATLAHLAQLLTFARMCAATYPDRPALEIAAATLIQEASEPPAIVAASGLN